LADKFDENIRNNLRNNNNLDLYKYFNSNFKPVIDELLPKIKDKSPKLHSIYLIINRFLSHVINNLGGNKQLLIYINYMKLSLLSNEQNYNKKEEYLKILLNL